MNELKIIKEYFPKSYNKFIKLFGLVNSSSKSNVSVINDLELNNFVLNHVKNLNLKVNYSKEDNVNAFTIPWDIDPNVDKNYHLTSYPILGDLYALNSVYLKLLKANIDATNVNEDLIFTHKLPSSFVLNVYQTSRFYSLLEHDLRARIAVMLHEIGHWHSVNPYIVNSILGLFRTFSYLIGIGFGIHSLTSNSGNDFKAGIVIPILLCISVIIYFSINYVRSINEANCDNFAKKLGYGEDAARAMYALAYGSNDFKELNQERFIKMTSTLGFKIKDIVYRIFHGYPSMNQRINSGITEGISLLTVEIEIKDFIKIFDNFFA